MPRVRSLSLRNARGRGWHKRGYREMGCLFFQLKRSYSGFSRTSDVNENETITNMIQNMLKFDLGREDPGELPEGLHYVFFFRRQILEPSQDIVKTKFDGGEIVYVKVLDEDGVEYICDVFFNEWYPKPKRGCGA